MILLFWLILFTLPDGGLYTYDLETGSIERIATCEDTCLHLAWSSDGRIGFLDGDYLSIVTLDDGARIDIPIDRGVYTYNVIPDWNADFTQVVYAARFDMQNRLVIVDITSEEATVYQNISAVDPRWLPDGRIGFYNNEGIHVFDPNTGDLIDLTPEGDIHDLPAWSPDGEEIALRARIGQSDYIWATMDADGTNGRVITSAIVERSVWSEDGERLVTLLWRDLKGEQIDLVMFTENELIVLAENAVSGYLPAWCDDQIIYIGISQTGTMGLYLVDLNTPLEPILLVEPVADERYIPASPIVIRQS